MGTIQHRNISDTEAHEPKNISTATSGQVYAANGSGSGVWKKLTEKDNFDFTDKSKNYFGWNDISDSQYTSGAPLSIAASTRTLLPNNGLAAQSDTSRLGAVWDAVNKQFLVNDLNATYSIRMNCKIKAAAAAGTPYVVKFEVESSNGPTVISAVDYTIKGGSYENAMAHTTLFYVGSFINNLPLKVYITSDTAITLYGIGFVVQRLYKET